VALAGSRREPSFAVEDDGHGVDATSAAGAGLAGMSARLAAVGGTLTIESAAGAGTRVTGIVPLAP
jgi:signal transduction histidine kinase